ncbi:MAG: NnrS family protein [Methylomonas sp.]|nr:NnrS family protein [Methylomonas sp.]PPD19676.1 MAG: short-chain dehydrogenase [Methylomonas sp.]PPD25826.1 MAG: short-chain dehydrogenase [Methylomonas sp.]PPD37286.1 MAG: short-chain dehydrogenase [Methylomonas sp.]PPD39051.1 MAG: short-chain dehydrogenase [Methylomonas sp.]
MTQKPVFDYPLFAMGFRLFFALAGLAALSFIALWNVAGRGSIHIEAYFPGHLWHAHEMLLGYATAVIAGFLLTAVRNWTSTDTTTPDQLAGLGLLWLYGRVTPFYADLLPDGVIAAIDFSFLPLLAYWIAKPILATRQFKNLMFPGLVLLLALGNGLVHLDVLGFTESTAGTGLNLVLTVIVMMMLVIAGRVFPFFTERGLSGVVCIRNPMLDGVTIGLSLLVLLLMMAKVSGWSMAIPALAAVTVNTLRVSGWYDSRIWFVPLLWVLYSGYAWIIVGFGLLAASALGWVTPSVTLHAFTVGGIGVLSLGMMARVSLGHTGRALKASNIMALAFMLINAAAILRVVFPAALPGWYGWSVFASAYLWLAAFALFMQHYLPMLASRRTDGKPG